MSLNRLSLSLVAIQDNVKFHKITQQRIEHLDKLFIYNEVN